VHQCFQGVNVVYESGDDSSLGRCKHYVSTGFDFALLETEKTCWVIGAAVPFIK
jgi:hypothetical protein